MKNTILLLNNIISILDLFNYKKILELEIRIKTFFKDFKK